MICFFRGSGFKEILPDQGTRNQATSQEKKPEMKEKDLISP
jgi:hypothetical protein